MKTPAPFLNLSIVASVPEPESCHGPLLGPLRVQPRKLPKCFPLRHPRITVDPVTLDRLPHGSYFARPAGRTEVGLYTLGVVFLARH